MATKRIRRIFPIALSISSLCQALGGIDRRQIDRDVALGLLPVYAKGVRKVVLVVDAIEYVRQNWKRIGVKP